MRKAPAALAAALIIASFAFPSVAVAADDDETDSTDTPLIISPEPRPKKHDGELKELHEKLEKKYGKDGRLGLPPMVIKPKKEFKQKQLETITEPEDSVDEDPSTSSSIIKSTTTPAPAATSNSTPADEDAATKSAGLGFVVVSPMQSLTKGVTTTETGKSINPESSSPAARTIG